MLCKNVGIDLSVYVNFPFFDDIPENVFTYFSEAESRKSWASGV